MGQLMTLLTVTIRCSLCSQVAAGKDTTGPWFLPFCCLLFSNLEVAILAKRLRVASHLWPSATSILMRILTLIGHLLTMRTANGVRKKRRTLALASICHY